MLGPDLPGEGMIARSAPLPLGYHGDPAKTAAVFRKIGGVRYAIPGDWARRHPDGSLELIGRGSLVINTGGEKVFVEEVEEALKRVPGIDDALVVGLPDLQWGAVVAALGEVRCGGAVRRPDGTRVVARGSGRIQGSAPHLRGHGDAADGERQGRLPPRPHACRIFAVRGKCGRVQQKSRARFRNIGYLGSTLKPSRFLMSPARAGKGCGSDPDIPEKTLFGNVADLEHGEPRLAGHQQTLAKHPFCDSRPN